MNWEIIGNIALLYLAINLAILVLTAILRPKQFWGGGLDVLILGSIMVLIAGLPLMLYFVIGDFVQTYLSRRRFAAFLAARQAEAMAEAEKNQQPPTI